MRFKFSLGDRNKNGRVDVTIEVFVLGARIAQLPVLDGFAVKEVEDVIRTILGADSPDPAARIGDAAVIFEVGDANRDGRVDISAQVEVDGKRVMTAILVEGFELAAGKRLLQLVAGRWF